MERLFDTHRIRKSRECSPVWTFTAPDRDSPDRPETVLVPGVWESHPRLRNYRGRGIYEQKIFCGGNVRFWMGGVSFKARVLLDGIPLAEHYGAYTGFEAFAPDLPYQEHTLRIEADNRFGEDSALHIPNDYYSYGGINRPVLVEELGEAFIAGCRLVPRCTPEGWALEAQVTVRSLSANALEGVLTIMAAGQQSHLLVRLPPREEAVFSFSVPCGSVTPWTPEAPVLYTAQAILSLGGRPVDDLIDRFGFREIRVAGKEILLNGKPLRLIGFNRHEEYAGFGLSVPPGAMMQDIRMMKDLGANCVRTAHYPNDPLFLDLCDETGLLVWEESHTRGFTEEQMCHPLFMPQLRQCTEEMIRQHFNHPSIFIWGCLNECADNTDYGAGCYREIFALMRSLDPTRPVTSALLSRAGGKVFGDMDVVSFNTYPLWYYKGSVRNSLQKKMDEAAAKGGAEKPCILSEIGAGAIYGYHDPLGEAKWSEERQCTILRKQLEAALSHPGICGVFLWQFADVRVSEEWFAQRPRTCNNKGIVDEYRRPKMAYRTVRSVFRDAGG